VPSHFPIGEGLAARARVCARALLLLVIVLATGVAGCPRKAVYVKVPQPLPPKTSASAPPPAPDLHPEEPGNLELTFVTLTPPAPPPDHISHAPPPVHHPAADSTAASHPAPLQISPQMSQADQAAYEHRTKDSIDAAEKNIQRTSGRQLSSAQQEMVEKIRQFISQAQDALTTGDYERAQNLAQKAEVLSTELVNTL